MLKPTLDEIKQLAKDGRYQTAPVCLEILVITSYSIHYTKLYEPLPSAAAASPA